jgi:hypothetical protein
MSSGGGNGEARADQHGLDAGAVAAAVRVRATVLPSTTTRTRAGTGAPDVLAAAVLRPSTA